MHNPIEAPMLFRFDDRPSENLNPATVGGRLESASTLSARREMRPRIEHDGPAAGLVEQAIAEAAALLTAADPAALDHAIVECFAQFGRLLSLTRVQLWTDVAGEGAVPTHEWPNPAALDGAIVNVTALPAVKTPLMRHEAVCFSSLDEIPASEQRELLYRSGIVAAAVLPVMRGRGAAGAL